MAHLVKRYHLERGASSFYNFLSLVPVPQCGFGVVRCFHCPIFIFYIILPTIDIYHL